MIPVVAAIASIFAQEGLSLLAGAVRGGKEKVIEKIEKKTGIDLKDVADPNTETVFSPQQRIDLERFQSDEILDLAKIVASADADKATGIVMAAVAPEIPEIVLFGMGLLLILGFALAKQYDTAGNLASAWLGAFAMYVKGK